ncbi:MAG: HTH-type transcriptional regulator DegA [Tenericutes bacterium ADurb.Bin239]|jgi:LacI family transcriptional regulator|nr:LacI family DNA-binding transcriptional regulator [Bacillota bacterium]OQA79051.1 MAG: HTH-type transcriptional regulator DegA [Tenericutes bacterium ADurb.Bin239]
MVVKRKSTSIKDIAKACNVSVATVSRALSKRGYVSEEKRIEIRNMAKKLGYIYNYNAQILQRGKSNTIGIIIADIENYFYHLVLKNLIIDFEKQGYKVLIAYSFENSDIERENITSFLSSKVDALIFTPISNKNEDLITLINKQNIPLLQLFRQAYPYVDAVCVDDGHGAYLATKHLLDQGLRNVLLLTVKLDFTPSRSKGYIQAHEELDLPINKELICRYPLGVSIKNECRTFIKTHNVDAIIAGTNTFGSEVMEVMREEKINLPLIVFDELNWLKMLNVTTIAQPIDLIHKDIVENIMTKLNDKTYVTPTIGQNIRVKPKLIVRKSSNKKRKNSYSINKANN